MSLILHNFTDAAKNAIKLAKQNAQQLGYSFIGTQHLLIGLMQTKNSVTSLILNTTISSTEIEKALKATVTKNKTYTPLFCKIIESAVERTKILGIKKTGTQQILLELLKHEHSCGLNLLKQSDELIESSLFAKSLACNYNMIKTNPKNNKIAEQTNLKLFGKNLTKLAKLKKLDPLIGRVKELKIMEQILARRKKNNPCLIGAPGVGKTAIVEGLAIKIAQKKVNSTLKNKQIIALNLSSILAGTKYRGEFEKRLELILEEAQQNTNIILFLDEIHTIVNAGAAQGAIDAANILKPSMARGDIQLIGTSTEQEFEKMIKLDPALQRRLQQIKVEEPSRAETFKILIGIKSNYEHFHNIKISNQAIKAAITLAKENFKNHFLPDVAIDLIDEACAKKKLKYQNSKPLILNSFNIANLIQEKIKNHN